MEIALHGHVCRAGAGLDRALGHGLLHHQLAIGGQHHAAATGRHVFRRAHADARLRAFQRNAPGIHAAKRRGIDAELRLFAAVIRLHGLHRAGGVIHLVAPGDDTDILPVQHAVDGKAAADDVEVIRLPRIQPHRADGHHAPVHGKAREGAGGRVKHGHTRGQRCPRRADEAAAVAGDAVRIGEDVIRPRAMHLRRPLQQGRIGAGHLVEDQPCFGARGQIGVCHHHAAELRLADGARIVQDQALCADVEVAELVVRQAGAVRRGDIHQRHAVARRGHLRQVACGCRRVGHDRLGIDRIGRLQQQAGGCQQGDRGGSGLAQAAAQKAVQGRRHALGPS